jgi:hypothetical protein
MMACHGSPYVWDSGWTSDSCSSARGGGKLNALNNSDMSAKGTVAHRDVDRSIDFSLKKEDLMLLILEGRKENLEEEIATLQQRNSDSWIKVEEKRKLFRKKVEAVGLSFVSESAKKLVSQYGLAKAGDKSVDIEDDDYEHDEDGPKFDNDDLRVVLTESSESYDYRVFAAKPIGEAKGGAFIKQEMAKTYYVKIFTRVEIQGRIAFGGNTYLKKNKFMSNLAAPKCMDSSRVVILGTASLDKVELHKTAEFVSYMDAVEAAAKCETLLSEITTEYDLFNRNQPRAKAKMIKEVLSRNEAGQDLLAAITTAAKGQKLLG